MNKNDYETNTNIIEHIVNSIKVNTSEKKYSYTTPSIISQDSFENIIQDEKRSKELDLLLLKLDYRDIKIKISESNEIETWKDFFNYKLKSPLKSKQVLKGYTGDILDIFEYYIHLGDYDFFYATLVDKQKLIFKFFNENEEGITWIVHFEGENTIELNQKIELHRFLFNKTYVGYTTHEGKIGYRIPFLINNTIHRLKIKEIEVY